MCDIEKLNWYVFEESYLLGVDFNLCQGVLTIRMDARKSNTNPRVIAVKEFEDYFEEIILAFKGVCYYRGVMDDNILDDPNDDLGGVDCLKIGRDLTDEDGILIEKNKNHLQLVLLEDKKRIANNYVGLKDLYTLEFVSEKISFILAFSNFELHLPDKEDIHE